MAKTKETQKRRLEIAEAKVAILRDVTKVARTPLPWARSGLEIPTRRRLAKEPIPPPERGAV